MELAKSGPVADHAAYIRELLSRVRAALTGYVIEEGLQKAFMPMAGRGRKLAFASTPGRDQSAERARLASGLRLGAGESDGASRGRSRGRHDGAARRVRGLYRRRAIFP